MCKGPGGPLGRLRLRNYPCWWGGGVDVEVITAVGRALARQRAASMDGGMPVDPAFGSSHTMRKGGVSREEKEPEASTGRGVVGE